MPDESVVRKKVVRYLRSIDAKAIENCAAVGTPDVNYIGGWMELKYRHDWPKREGTIVTIDHFTPYQRNFLRRRWHMGGGSCLLFRVNRIYMLFTGCTGANVVGKVDKATLMGHASRLWVGGLEPTEFLETVKGMRLLGNCPCIGDDLRPERED